MGHVEFGPRHLLRLGGIDVQLGVDDKLSFAAPMRILLQTSKLDFALELKPASTARASSPSKQEV